MNSAPKVDIELRQLRYFVAVAEELNFTRAAERLQIAQPPLSRQIQSLEKALGVTLLERTNRRVVLTSVGEFFLTECRQILAQLEYSIQATQRLANGETGQLVLGFEGSTYNNLVLNIIREFRTQYPDVKLVMREMPSGQQVDALHKGQLDAAHLPVATGEEITVVPLLVEPLMGAITKTHPLANHSSLNLMQLAEEPWITGRSSDGCGLQLRIMAACRQAGFVPQVHQQTNDLQMILGFVASGLGVTLLPKSACRSGVMGVSYLPLQDPVPQIEIAIAWEPKAQSPVLHSFLQLVGMMAEVEIPN